MTGSCFRLQGAGGVLDKILPNVSRPGTVAGDGHRSHWSAVPPFLARWIPYPCQGGHTRRTSNKVSSPSSPFGTRLIRTVRSRNVRPGIASYPGGCLLARQRLQRLILPARYTTRRYDPAGSGKPPYWVKNPQTRVARGYRPQHRYAPARTWRRRNGVQHCPRSTSHPIGDPGRRASAPGAHRQGHGPGSRNRVASSAGKS